MPSLVPHEKDDQPPRQCGVKDQRFNCDDYRWIEYDARGIELALVCTQCKKAKLAGYRPEVLTNPQYECDEELWEEEGI